jgi:hypothetical protein
MLGEPPCGADRRSDRRHDEIRIAHGLKAHPPDTVLPLLDDLCGGLKPEARLAGAAGSGERQETNALASEQAEHVGQLPLAACERRRLLGQVGLVQGLERREFRVAELIQGLGRR